MKNTLKSEMPLTSFSEKNFILPNSFAHPKQVETNFKKEKRNEKQFIVDWQLP